MSLHVEIQWHSFWEELSDIALRVTWPETDRGASNASLLVLCSRLSPLWHWNASKLLIVRYLFAIFPNPIAECIFPTFGHFMFSLCEPWSQESLLYVLLCLCYTSNSPWNLTFRNDKSVCCIAMRMSVTGRKEGKQKAFYLLQDFWSHEISFLQAFSPYYKCLQYFLKKKNFTSLKLKLSTGSGKQHSSVFQAYIVRK